MVQTTLVEVQPFKEVENYFIDSLLYQKDIEPLKQSLPDDVDSGNKAYSESKENVSAIFSIKSIVAYLNDPIVITPPKMRVSGSSMKMLLLITLCVLTMYLNLSILVLFSCLYPSRKWHAYI